MSARHALADLTPLRTSPVFRRLWFGRSVSMFGSQMTAVAVLYQVWQDTGSTVWTGAVGLAQAIPLLGLGLFAGSVVDRVDRRRAYQYGVLGALVCSALLAVQGAIDGTPVLVVLGLVAAQTCCGTFTGPAAASAIPRLLPPDQVAAGLALNRISSQAALLAGPAVGGLAIDAVGVSGCYLLDALTFGVGLYGAFGLPALRPYGDRARAGFGGVVDGLGHLVRDGVVRGVLLADLAVSLLSFPMSLFPLINTERFGGSPRTLGLFLSAIAIGGVVASTLSGTFTRHPRPGRVVLAGAVVWSVMMLGFGLVPDPWLALGFLVVAGAADTVSVVSRNAVVQLHTGDAFRGRVAAAETAVGAAGPNLGNLRAGLVAGATSATTSVVSGAVLCLVALGVVAATNPGLRSYRVPARDTVAT